MKTLQKLLFLVLIYQSIPALVSAQAAIPLKSQNPEKPFNFAGLPDRFECSYSALRQLFVAEINDEITLQLTRNLSFHGIVATKLQRDANVLSVNIFSSNFPGTLLNISLIRNANQTEKIIGRFINPKKGDVLLIEQEKNRFYITKDLQKFVMSDCPLPPATVNSPNL